MRTAEAIFQKDIEFSTHVFAHMEFVGDGWDSWDARSSWEENRWSQVSVQRPQGF